jgi:hypothetical protein
MPPFSGLLYVFVDSLYADCQNKNRQRPVTIAAAGWESTAILYFGKVGESTGMDMTSKSKPALCCNTLPVFCCLKL